MEGHFVIDLQSHNLCPILQYVFRVHRKHSIDLRTNPFCCVFHELCAQTSFCNGLSQVVVELRFYDISLAYTESIQAKRVRNNLAAFTCYECRLIIPYYSSQAFNSRHSYNNKHSRPSTPSRDTGIPGILTILFTSIIICIPAFYAIISFKAFQAIHAFLAFYARRLCQ